MTDNDRKLTGSPVIGGKGANLERPPRSNNRIRGNSLATQQLAYQHRRELTPAEKKLWAHLRYGHLGGLRFRRQHPVGRFILDFYCSRCKLAVEVDGEIHDTTVEYDRERETTLAQYGYRVVRFRNDQVLHDTEGVLQAILAAAKELFSRDPVSSGSGPALDDEPRESPIIGGRGAP